MRTRRSPRNQERVWKYLTPPLPPAPAPVVRSLDDWTDEEIRASRLAKADKTRLLKANEKRRLVAQIKAELAKEG